MKLLSYYIKEYITYFALKRAGHINDFITFHGTWANRLFWEKFSYHYGISWTSFGNRGHCKNYLPHTAKKRWLFLWLISYWLLLYEVLQMGLGKCLILLQLLIFIQKSVLVQLSRLKGDVFIFLKGTATLMITVFDMKDLNKPWILIPVSS